MFADHDLRAGALTKALLPAMRAAGRGRIVMVSSAGGVRGMPATAPYSAAKGALERWGESLAGEIAPFGLGVTVLVTGTYDTDIITDAGTTDCRDFDGPYARHHATMDKRGRLAMKYAASRRTGSPPDWPRRWRARAPFARRAGRAGRADAAGHEPATAAAAMHQMTRLIMGIPRYGAARVTPSATRRATTMADSIPDGPVRDRRC